MYRQYLTIVRSRVDRTGTIKPSIALGRVPEPTPCQILQVAGARSIHKKPGPLLIRLTSKYKYTQVIRGRRQDPWTDRISAAKRTVYSRRCDQL